MSVRWIPRGLGVAPSARTPPGWIEWLVGACIAVATISVNIPAHLNLYSVSAVTAALLVPLVVVQAVTIPLVLAVPRASAALHLVSVVGIALASAPVGAVGASAPPWPMPVFGMIALCLLLVALALRGRLVTGIVTWLVATAALVAVAQATAERAPLATVVFIDLVVSASVTATVFVVAATVVQLAQARRDVQREREQKEVLADHRRWDIERSRIAREMHDVVAHSMSLVHMRATSARYRLHDMSDEVADEFDGIALQARTALGEMRGLLGVLREGADSLDAPQPTLTELPALVSATRDAGVVVRLVLVEPLPEPSRRCSSRSTG